MDSDFGPHLFTSPTSFHVSLPCVCTISFTLVFNGFVQQNQPATHDTAADTDAHQESSCKRLREVLGHNPRFLWTSPTSGQIVTQDCATALSICDALCSAPISVQWCSDAVSRQGPITFLKTNKVLCDPVASTAAVFFPLEY